MVGYTVNVKKKEVWYVGVYVSAHIHVYAYIYAKNDLYFLLRNVLFQSDIEYEIYYCSNEEDIPIRPAGAQVNDRILPRQDSPAVLDR